MLLLLSLVKKRKAHTHLISLFFFFFFSLSPIGSIGKDSKGSKSRKSSRKSTCLSQKSSGLAALGKGKVTKEDLTKKLDERKKVNNSISSFTFTTSQSTTLCCHRFNELHFLFYLLLPHRISKKEIMLLHRQVLLRTHITTVPTVIEGSVLRRKKILPFLLLLLRRTRRRTTRAPTRRNK